jgi:hypothetical protein
VDYGRQLGTYIFAVPGEFGANRIYADGLESGLPSRYNRNFGTSGNAKVGISFPNQRFNGFTNQGFNANISDVGTTAYNGGVIDNTYSYVDNLTWQRGRHFLSAGMDARRYQNNYPTGNNDGYLGSLNYTGNFTSNGNGSGGYGPADFVLDRVQSGGVTLSSVNVGQRQWRVAGFAQDNYKIRANLTLIFGIRYEFDEPWIEEQNRTETSTWPRGRLCMPDHIPAAGIQLTA